MKRIITAAFAASLLLAAPSFAQGMKDTMGSNAMACDDTSMMKTNDMVMKMGDGAKKQMAMKEMGMAKDAMAKKDSKGCMMHLQNAEKAMK